MADNNFVKILFRFYSDILDEETVETMWATVIDQDKGYYQLGNIPFYAPVTASSDIVFAEFDEDEGMLTYRSTVEYSGNSTIHVIIMDETHEINSIREIFSRMGCESERLNNNYFAMEIPSDIDYAPIKKMLDDLQSKEILGYAESCIGENH
jgi:hypothetical protein